jgi:hypothetical protein
MGFDPCNHLLKIRESIGSPLGVQLPKWEITWDVRVHSLTLFCTPRSMRCDYRASLLAHNLANPCLGPKPKARVTIGGFPKSGSWWVLWVRICLWFVLAVKCFNYPITNLLFGLCRSMWMINWLSFFLVPFQSSSTPLYPQSVAS